MMGGPNPLPVVTEGQTYCLRWNNHKSNLVEILDALIKVESYVDCTIVVDDQVQFKAHRVVLAANSPYFQAILQDVPMDHCSIIFPGVKAFEMRALLEYMYTGEVNVTQSQIPKIMRIAEELEVKGLFDMADLKEKFNKLSEEHSNERNSYNDRISMYGAGHNGNASGGGGGGGSGGGGGGSKEDLTPHHSGHHSHLQNQNSSSVISTSSPSAMPSSSSSPPYGSYKSPYSSIYSKSPGPSTAAGNVSAAAATSVANTPPQSTGNMTQQLTTGGGERNSQWPLSPSAATAAMLSSVYESGADMNPLKRKKLSSISSMLMNRDTPILRNVLAQTNPADSSQPMPLLLPGAPVKTEKSSSSTSGTTASAAAAAAAVAAAAASAALSAGVDKAGLMAGTASAHNNNHSFNGSDYSNEKKYPDEPHSPYTDRSFEDEAYDTKGNSYSGSFGSSASNQKPEWKRYKQYTRNDIMSAIQCVRDGMSALQASRKFGVPSRTLYDKVKKLGITTGRPMNRTMKRSPSNAESSAAFPYTHGYGQSEPLLASLREARLNSRDDGEPKEHHHHHLRGGGGRDGGGGGRDGGGNDHHHLSHATLSHPAAALLDHAFLQQALESRGGDIAGREALHAMALAAAAHAAANRLSNSPGPTGNGTRRSASPSGFALKYAAAAVAAAASDNDHDDHDKVHRHSMDIERELDAEHERERERECKRERDDIELDEQENEADDEGDDQVEDLSVARKESSLSPEPRHRPETPYSPPPPSSSQPPPSSSTLASTENGNSIGVIVPPLNTKYTAAAASPTHSTDEYTLKESRAATTPTPSTTTTTTTEIDNAMLMKREVLSDDGRTD